MATQKYNNGTLGNVILPTPSKVYLKFEVSCIFLLPTHEVSRIVCATAKNFTPKYARSLKNMYLLQRC